MIVTVSTITVVVQTTGKNVPVNSKLQEIKDNNNIVNIFTVNQEFIIIWCGLTVI